MKSVQVLLLVACVVLQAASAAAQQSDKPQNPPPANQPPKSEPAKNEPSNKPAAKHKIPKLEGFDALEPGKRSANAGATRGMAPPVALAPRLARVYGNHPTFTWQEGDAAPSCQFVLSNDSYQPVFRTEVKGTSYRYDEKAPALEPGRTYLWTAEASGPMGGMRASDRVGFIVVSGDERRKIEQSLAKISTGDAYRQGLERARVFTKFRLWYDTVDAYSDLIARYPDRVELYKERGAIYWQLEVTRKIAGQDLARADELEGAAK